MISPKKKRRLRVVANVAHVYKAVDDWIQESQPEFEAQSGKIQCKRGCNACCRMWIIVTMPEALAIVTQYEDVVKEVRDKLERADELGTALTRKHFTRDGSLMSAETNATICSEWMDAWHSCPFLGDNGDCRVYEARPVACRTYLVVTDPKLCYEDSRAIIGARDLREVQREFTEVMLGLSSQKSAGPLANYVLGALRIVKGE